MRATDGCFVDAIIAQPGQARRRSELNICSLMHGIETWRWVRKTYLCSYIIRTKGRRIGLVGLYGLDDQRSAELSLIIVEKERGRGYGRESCELLLNRLCGQHAIDGLRVRVTSRDAKTLHFWEKVGFRVGALASDRIILNLVISSRRAPVYAYPCG